MSYGEPFGLSFFIYELGTLFLNCRVYVWVLGTQLLPVYHLKPAGGASDEEGKSSAWVVDACRAQMARARLVGIENSCQL